MAEYQVEVAGNVIAFGQRMAQAQTPILAAFLTPRDRMDLTDLRETASAAGYDRMVIHDRDDGDAADVGNFLSVYKRGDAWSRWGFARRGAVVRAWCCLSGRDAGEFDSLGEALLAVLGSRATLNCATSRASAIIVPMDFAPRRVGTVTDLHGHLTAFRTTMGSAA